MAGNLHEDQYTLLNISRSVSLRMRNASDNMCRDNQNTRFTFNKFFENCTVYELMWKNIVQPNRLQMTI